MAVNWPGNADVFPFCEPIIKQFEGWSATPYRDSVGIPTIGWGTICYPNGQTVTMNDAAITAAYATICLESEMTQKANVIAQHTTRMPTLHQAAAMLSLAYNIGVAESGFLGSTVLRKFNAGAIQAAADAFLMWNKGTQNGKLIPITGLTNRRKQERAIFLTPDDDAGT